MAFLSGIERPSGLRPDSSSPPQTVTLESGGTFESNLRLDSTARVGRLSLPASIAAPLFTATVFTGASLLFLVQPMFAKLTLPRLGGSPAVWNTCVLFFQTTLLLGYLYAHISTQWLSIKRQTVFHVLVLLVPLISLPLSAGEGQPSADQSPVWWVLRTMALQVGLPFFIVSTTAPLLQRWFASLSIPTARDPYFLYAASNLGSMIALLGYPFAVEPAIGTKAQTIWWSAGYLVLAALTTGCALVTRSLTARPVVVTESSDHSGHAPTWSTRLSWVVLSFLPSSLMLGVTTHVSTDIAPVPLLWVLPLAIYLGTFVIVFASRQWIADKWLTRLLPLLVYSCIITILMNARVWWLIPLHLAAFFVAALLCHGELARRRPHPYHLTDFYIWMSLGGVLGGVFNSLLAPQLFNSIVEYPLVLACVSFLRPSPRYRAGERESFGFLLGLPGFVIGLVLAFWASGGAPNVELRPLLFACASLLAIGYMFANRTAPFGVMALTFVVMIVSIGPAGSGRVLFADRSFFGVHRVIEPADGSYHLLQHGSTTHGRQEMSAVDGCAPTGYYHPENPIGQLFAKVDRVFHRVALIGLGSGGLACYATPGAQWTFYEIDPLVEQIAREPRYFTFLRNSPGEVDVVLGDGRLMLQRAPSGVHDLIILDAFSSDGIPAHLLTREAMQLYLSALVPDGIIAAHISNRYLHLEPLVAALTSELGLFAIANRDVQIDEVARQRGRLPSHWVLATRNRQALTNLVGLPGWRELERNASVRPWTDDYSNILQVLTPR